MNSSQSFIQEYPVISFDLFIHAKITQCKIGLFCYVAKQLNSRNTPHLKIENIEILQKSYFLSRSILKNTLIETEIGFLVKTRPQLYFYITNVCRIEIIRNELFS